MIIIIPEHIVQQQKIKNKIVHWMSLIKDSNNPFLKDVYKTLKKKYDE